MSVGAGRLFLRSTTNQLVFISFLCKGWTSPFPNLLGFTELGLTPACQPTPQQVVKDPQHAVWSVTPSVAETGQERGEGAEET